MRIESQALPQIDSAYPKPKARSVGIKGFGDMLEIAVQKVDAQQHFADDKLQALASGKDIDIHGTMIALQEADISLRFAVSVRDKLIDGYNKIINMSI